MKKETGYDCEDVFYRASLFLTAWRHGLVEWDLPEKGSLSPVQSVTRPCTHTEFVSSVPFSSG